MNLNNKTILLTGGTGSFGNKFTELLLKNYTPKSLRIFSRGEHKQREMKNKFDSNRLRFFIGNVRDKERLHRAMNGVDIVVHAAALKQIPAAEYNPLETIKTNIRGAENVINAALDNDVERVMAISTDKAVNPVNLYGATKLCAERLFVQSNSYVGKGKTKISCVRYGNVLGSRGSVVPLFLKQKKSGELTITDERMTRFWITLEQGINFVINSIERMEGGEVFVPKIPSMKIVDLAKAIAPEAELEAIGIRPGEKLHEVLLPPEEARHAKEFDDYFVIEPEFDFWNKENCKDGKDLPEGFKYSSDNNDQWLSKKELRKLLKDLDIKHE
ncbi:flagellin modification protein FlmA [candidate division MSBL1 archaeon SCGC-AAA382N08]|uniref:Flagellin modification protein FlmA n=1 Tax=candidate division MSBL1 archaeon SCGC-AAA382N08 TaxID=1698285 RepID=A0A133VP18_9EURY|nr:flagellin modification protein FlmA [candidate division MSBL1 archaeon SCGC-AAA382N08]